MEYEIIRSNRKTLGLQVSERGVLVRAPHHATQEEIDRLVTEYTPWIRRQQEKLQERLAAQQPVVPLTGEDLQALAQQAMLYIPMRVQYYANRLGIRYGRITIRNQKTRWGSCSGKGNLNFNCLLMLTPKEVIDAVVVHELCHRRHMNHSREFYQEIYRVYPEYDKWNRWLKENGPAIMRRMTG